MREYKFRERDVHDVWHHGYLANIRLQSVPRWDSPTVIRFAEIVDEDDLTNRVDPETVGQFTGMHDCDGHEIYEGDVVRIDDWSTPSFIRWDDVTASFVVDRWSVNLAHVSQIKVVGNIHDNPELLEVAHD